MVSLDTDVKGDAYEGLLQKNAEEVKGGAGQCFTPRPLIRGDYGCDAAAVWASTITNNSTCSSTSKERLN
jgi:hypothetical protein